MHSNGALARQLSVLLLLGYFVCHRRQRGRLLAFGILGAIAFRGLAIVAGVAILQALEQTIYVFGAGLLVVAYRSLVDGGARSNTATGRCDACPDARRPDYRRVSRESIAAARTRRLYATPLLLALLAISPPTSRSQSNSIPASFAVTRDWTAIWLANAFRRSLGMRSLIALVDDLVRRFRYIDKTIACVIAFRRREDSARSGARAQQRGDRRHHRRGVCRRRRRVDRRRPLRPAVDARAAASSPASLSAGSVVGPKSNSI